MQAGDAGARSWAGWPGWPGRRLRRRETVTSGRRDVGGRTFGPEM